MTGEHRLRPSREAGNLLVPNMHPFDFTAANCVGDKIQCIARYAPASFYASCLQRFHDDVSDSFGHFSSPGVHYDPTALWQGQSLHACSLLSDRHGVGPEQAWAPRRGPLACDVTLSTVPTPTPRSRARCNQSSQSSARGPKPERTAAGEQLVL